MAYMTISINSTKEYDKVMDALRGVVSNEQIIGNDPLFSIRDELFRANNLKERELEALESMCVSLRERCY